MARILIAGPDDFNRASIGANWQNNLNGSNCGAVLINASTTIVGQFSFGATFGGASARWVGTGVFTADQYSKFTIGAASNFGASSAGGVIVRASSGVDGSRAFYEFVTVGDAGSGGNHTTYLNKWTGNTRTALATGTVPWADGDTIELEIVGNTLTAMRNGVALGGIWTVTDSTSPITAAGAPGITAGSSGMLLDNWEGGNITAGDVTAPTLTSPTGSATGTTTGSGTVITDEGNGTLYFLATTNATETAATVKASGGTQAISSTGTKTVSFTGLTASTTYYAHYVHRDASGNDSTVANSTSFTTSAPDVTAPTLTSPTGTATGSTTASGSVTTNEGNGTLYRLASINASESAATVKAAALTQTVVATGSQPVTFTGLSAGTTYYAHYVHRDAAGNDSTVASSASFTTTSGDTTAPTLTAATASATGSTTASGSVTTNEGNGTLYGYVSTNATETAATVKASGQTQAISSTGAKTFSFTGLTPSTTYYAHYVHRDAAGNDSTVANTTSFVTSAVGSLTLPVLKNNTGTILSSQTGITAHIYAIGGSLVVTKTSQTTNGSGICVLTDAAIVPATTYRVVIVLGSGAEGMDKVTAT